MGDVELRHIFEWQNEITPYGTCDCILPPELTEVFVRVECEILDNRKNRQQRAADLRRKFDLPIEPPATDTEVKNVLKGELVVTNGNRYSFTVEENTESGMSELFCSTYELGQMRQSKTAELCCNAHEERRMMKSKWALSKQSNH